MSDKTTETIVRCATEADWPHVEKMLVDANMPLDGARAAMPDFLVAAHSDEIVGAAALEQYASAALLRSVVVRSDMRGTGVGHLLVAQLLATTPLLGVKQVALLTKSKVDFFRRFGFYVVSRTEAPAAVQESVEFRMIFPDTVVAMLLDLHND